MGGRDVVVVLGKCPRTGTDPPLPALALNPVQEFLSRL